MWIQNERYQDTVIIERLVRAATRGVKVHVLTKKPHSLKPGKLVEGIGGLRILQDVGVKVHTLKHLKLHAKMMLADDKRAIVGSINLAPGSFDSRRELAIETDHHHAVKRLEETAHADWEASHKIDLSDEGLLADLKKRDLDASQLALGEHGEDKKHKDEGLTGAVVLYDASRHEQCSTIAWDEARARAMIGTIVADTESRFSPDTFWPMHPLDADDGSTEPAYPLYHGACGVIWALRYLQNVGAARLDAIVRTVPRRVDEAQPRVARCEGIDEPASYMMGETSILMLMFSRRPITATSPTGSQQLIERNVANPTRELMWGAPGTMLAALFMHERTGESRWAETVSPICARMLWSQLLWSPRTRMPLLDAGHVRHAQHLHRRGPRLRRHGVAAHPGPSSARRTRVDGMATLHREHRATLPRRRKDGLANWRAWLVPPPDGPARGMLMQFCHGAPGFVIYSRRHSRHFARRSAARRR